MPQPKPPQIHAIENVTIPPLEQHVLPNGLGCYHINQGTQELVRIEFICWGGRPYERHPLVAAATAALLKEGTARQSGSRIAEKLDFYGAGLSAPFQMDTGNLAIYCLNKQLKEVLPLFIEILTEPALQERELLAHINRKKQALKEDLSKAEVLAYRQITASFFGNDHPYGYNSSPAAFDALNTNWLREHHQRTYHAGNAFVIISGHFDSKTAAYIHQQLAQIPSGAAATPNLFSPITAKPQKLSISHPSGGQAAIRIGRSLFSRSHPDANGVYVLAHLLGGYFGSRLMENIREDKGYTYNISASYDSLRFGGSLQIDTEVSPEYVEPTLREIRKEIIRLQEEPVTAAELQMLRNYLMGSFLTMIDGPFNWAETVRTLLVEQLSVHSLSRLIETVQEMTPESLQQLAKQYLQQEDLWTVVVGP